MYPQFTSFQDSKLDIFRKISKRVQILNNLKEGFDKFKTDEKLNTVFIGSENFLKHIQQTDIENKCNFYLLKSPPLTNFFGIGIPKSKEIDKYYQYLNFSPHLDSTLKKDINKAILKISADGTKSGLKERVNSKILKKVNLLQINLVIVSD